MYILFLLFLLSVVGAAILINILLRRRDSSTRRKKEHRLLELTRIWTKKADEWRSEAEVSSEQLGENDRRYRTTMALCAEEIRRNIEMLARQRKELLKKDKHGKSMDKKWEAAKADFITIYILPKLKELGMDSHANKISEDCRTYVETFSKARCKLDDII